MKNRLGVFITKEMLQKNISRQDLIDSGLDAAHVSNLINGKVQRAHRSTLDKLGNAGLDRLGLAYYEYKTGAKRKAKTKRRTSKIVGEAEATLKAVSEYAQGRYIILDKLTNEVIASWN